MRVSLESDRIQYFIAVTVTIYHNTIIQIQNFPRKRDVTNSVIWSNNLLLKKIIVKGYKNKPQQYYSQFQVKEQLASRKLNVALNLKQHK